MRFHSCQTAMLLVDVQERLFSHIHSNEMVEKYLLILLKGLKCLDVPILCNQQYTKGLGETIASVRTLLGETTVYEKCTFSCYKNDEVIETLKSLQVKSVILAGVETHVCVLQTALDLLDAGFEVILSTDTMGSRKRSDHEIALRRMEQEGVRLSTSESLLFELLQSALHPKFKEVSALVKAL